MGIFTIIGIGIALLAGGASYVQAKQAQKKAKKLANSMAGVLLNKESNIEPLPVIYGSRRVGGVRVFVETSGPNNEYLYMALALCEGEVGSIAGIEIDGVSRFDSRFSGLVAFQTHTGADDQSVSSLLIGAPSWTTNHRLRGVAYLSVRLKWDQDAFSGIPEITALVTGKRVYDPRTGNTTWSSNPALCIRDYLTNTRYGKGLPASAIDDDAFSDAADDCDNFTVTPYSGATSNIDLFQCNAVIDTGEEIFRNVEKMLLGCRGFLPYTNGKYALYIDQSKTHTLDLTLDNIIGGITFAGEKKEDKFNRVIVKFPNPSTKWQEDAAIWPDAGSTEESTYLGEDNNVLLVDEVEMETVTNYYSARDFARIFLLRSRNGIRVSLQATSEAINLVVGDVVRLTHPTPSFTNKPFQVEQVTLNYDGTVNLDLLEYDSTIYTYDTAAEETDYPDTDLPDPFTVAAPTGLTLTESTRTEGDGTIIPSVLVEWTAADDLFVNSYEVQYKLDTATTYKSLITGATEFDLTLPESGADYDIRVRSINSAGVRSSFVTDQVSIVGDNVAPGTPTNGSVGSDTHLLVLTWDNPSDSDFSYTEIKRSNDATEGNATSIAKISGESFSDGPFAVGTTRYYWLRAVDRSGNASAWVSAGSGTTVALAAGDLTGDLVNTSIYRGIVTDDALAPSNTEFSSVAGRNPREHDIAITVDTTASPDAYYAWEYDGNSWDSVPNLISGNLVVDGSITADKITVDNLAAINSDLGTLTAGSIDASVVTVSNITADNITAGTIAADRLSIDGVTIDTNASGELIIADGGVDNTQLADGAVTIDKFGTDLEPVQVVSSLPGTATAGQMAFLTTDNKLYRYNGTAWTAAVPVGDVTGAGDLAALDTITLTYVTDAGDVAALDSISETYIDDDSITTVKINAQAVTAAKIQANTITAAQIAANTITANEIAANTITANQIAANTITSNEVAANTITAGEIAAGTITADELAANAVTGQVFDASSYLKAGSGDNSAVMSGRSVDEYAFWAGKGFETDGGPSGADAPFRVTRDGKVIMTNFALYSEAGTKLFDSQDGLLALPQTAVAQASGSLVPQVSEELTSGTDTFTVTLSSTQTITANFAYPVGALYYSGTSLTDAQNNVSSAFAVTLQYSSDSGSTWNTFGSTQNFSKVTSGTPTSSQYLVIANSFTVSIIYGAAPTTVYVASLQSNRGAIDEGMTLVGSTSQSLAAGTYLVRMVFSATGGSGTGAPATDKTREIRLTTSGAGFTVSDGTVSDGVGTSATTGWVLQNFVEKTESDNVTINGTLTLGGNLVVNGTTTTINSTTLTVNDKNIVLADGAANAAAANGAGITIDGASATFTYSATPDSFQLNKTLTIEPSGNYGTGLVINTGDTNAAAYGSKNIVMSFGGSTSIDYAHSIRTRHSSGVKTGNTVEFWLWDQGVDASSTIGTKQALVLENSTGLDLKTGGYRVGGTEVINSDRNIYANNYYFANGLVVAQATDSYLRINQSNQFGSGTWFGSSNIMSGTAYIATGSNGGSTSSRVYLYGGTYDGTNVIALDGSDGKIKGSYYQVAGTTVLDSNRDLQNIRQGTFTRNMNTTSGALSFDTSKTILGTIHVANGAGAGGAPKHAAITFQGDSASQAQAGIYVINDNSNGTAMAFATTGSYTAGPQIGLQIDYYGNVDIKRNALKIGGTTVIDASRNLTNIGTISSGAITASSIITGSGATGSTIGGVRAYGSSSAYMGASDGAGRTAFFGVDTSGYAMFGALTNHDTVIRANNNEYLRVKTNSNVNVVSGALEIGGTPVIDSSRNLTNIGTISSSAITATGTSLINNFRLGDSSKMAFGDIKTTSTISHTSTTEEGIFWHQNSDYGIYRTIGAWGSPNYQQIRIKWITGIELDGGSAYGKSGVNIINSDLQIGGTTIVNSSRTVSNVDLYALRTEFTAPYISPTNPNTLNAGLNWNSDSADLWINYRGYQDGFTQFRDFRIGNGRGTGLLFVDGSASSFDFQNGAFIQIGGTAVIDSSRRFYVGGGSIQHSSRISFLNGSNGTTGSGAQGIAVESLYAGTSYSNTAPSGMVNALNGYQVGNTTVIDSSRNLTNIGGGAYKANIGSASFSWGGATSYPTIYGSSADRWVILCFPHIPFLQNGVRGHTGSTWGAKTRYEGDTSTTTYWDVGCKNANQWSLYRNETDQILNVNNSDKMLQANYGLYLYGRSANWNETTPGLGVGTIHMAPATPDNYGSAITWGASDASAGTNAQAGIYIRSDGSYGTQMYLATTDSYATGSRTAITINHAGTVYLNRSYLSLAQIRLNDSGSRMIRGETKNGYNSVTVTGNWNEFNIMGRVLDWTANNLHFGDGYNGVNHSGHYFQIGTGTGKLNYFRVGSDIYADGNVVAYYSDARLKQNVETIPNALDIIKGIRGVYFEWNKKSEEVWAKKEGEKDFGLISQEVEAVFPMGVAVQCGADKAKEMGYGDPESPYYDPLHTCDNEEEQYKTVKYDKMVAVAVQAINEQQEIIERQQSQIDELKTLIKQLMEK